MLRYESLLKAYVLTLLLLITPCPVLAQAYQGPHCQQLSEYRFSHGATQIYYFLYIFRRDAVKKNTAPAMLEAILVQDIEELLLTEPQKEVRFVISC